jgi:hypothetical protein
MIERAIRPSLVCAVLFLAAGCTSFEIFNPTALEGLEVSDDSKVVTYHGSYWGFYWSETDHIPCVLPVPPVAPDPTVPPATCGGDCQGLHKVVSHSNLGYSLAPVFTLGLWAPSTVEYWCYHEAPDDPDGGTELPPEDEE